jgi:hypothetical protein
MLAPAAAPFTLARTSLVGVAPPLAAALFGAPLDQTESFRSGAAEGPAAVREFSESLETYSPTLDADLEDLTLLDLGDVAAHDLPAGIEEVAAAMEQATSLARLGVMFGGEHTVTLGGYRGARRVHQDAALLVLDAHLDLREEWNRQPVTHASWVSRAGEEAGLENIVQLGVRSGAREEWPRARATRWSGGAPPRPPPRHPPRAAPPARPARAPRQLLQRPVRIAEAAHQLEEGLRPDPARAGQLQPVDLFRGCEGSSHGAKMPESHTSVNRK